MIKRAPRITSFGQLSITLSLLYVSGFAAVSAATHLTGAPAPDFVLKSQSGENLRLSEYRGSVVMISFWASWCGGCRAELTDLEALTHRHAGADFQLLAVNLDRERSEMTRTAAALDISYPTLHDNEQLVSRRYEIESLPVSVLIDRDGMVRDVIEDYRDGAGEDPVAALLQEYSGI